jgi:hypothetical protein
MRCNKKERENDGQRERGIFNRRENMHTSRMHYNRENTKSFNAREKMKAMAREKKRLLFRGDNTCRFGRHCNREERERVMARGKKKEILGKGERNKYLAEGKKWAHPR